MAKEGLVQLNKNQLLRLSDIIHDQEFEQIRQIPFDYEGARVKHFDACNDNHKTIKNLLESTPEQHGLDEKLYEVWHLIWEFLKGAINFGLQAMNSYSVRVEFIEKVVNHMDESIAKLQTIDPDDKAAVRLITKDAQKFKDAMYHYNDKYRSLASKAFSQELQDKGIGFKQLIERYMEKREIQGAFEDLPAAEQYMLSQEILYDSGRGSKIIDEAFASARKELVAGFALFAFVAAVTVFDILADPSTPTMVRMAKTVKDFAASITGSTLGHMAEHALKETAWAALLAEEAAIDIFAVVGFVTGIGIGVVLGVLGEFLIDAIFTSGGTRQQNAAKAPAYFASLPDGQALAKDIYYR